MLSEPRQKEVTRRRRQYHDVFAGLIERGQEEGLYRTDIPRAVLVAHFFADVHYLSNWYSPEGAEDKSVLAAAADRPLPRRDQGLTPVRAWQVVRYGEPAEVLEIADARRPDARSRAGARPACARSR